MNNTPSIQFFKNIKLIDVTNCYLYRYPASGSFHKELSKDEIDTVLYLLNTSERIEVLNADMPSINESSWVYVNLKNGKLLKLMLVKGGFCFTENNKNYRIVQLMCKDILNDIKNKYIDIPPDKCDLKYVVNLFSDYGMKLNGADGYHLALNKSYGKYYYCNNDLNSKIAIYTFDSNQEMQKGLEEYEYKKVLLAVPYQKVYYIKNVIIVILGKKVDDFYINRLLTMIDYINDKPDNLFPIESYKILDSIKNLKFSSDTDEKCFFVTTYKSGDVLSEMYKVKNNGNISITVTPNEEFIISFYYSTAVPFKWKLKNFINDSVLQSDKENTVYHQNFYFRAGKEGTEKLVFRCEPTINTLIKDNIEITLNISIKI